MKVKSHKEPWYDGKSEVHFVVTAIWGGGWDFYLNEEDFGEEWPNWAYNPIYEGYRVWSSSGVAGDRMGTASRTAVKNQNTITVNRPVAYNWGHLVTVDTRVGADNRGDNMAFLVYEWDNVFGDSRPYTISTSGYHPNRILQTGYNSVTLLSFSKEAEPYFKGSYVWQKSQQIFPDKPAYPCGDTRTSTIEFRFISSQGS